MARVNIYRLKRTDGLELVVNDPWPYDLLIPDEKGELKKVPAGAVVGAIFFVEETTKIESWVEEEDEDDGKGGKRTRMVTMTESTKIPGHFEVWAFPEEQSLLNKLGQTRCLRVQREQALDVEEIWPLEHAKAVVRLRRDATELPDAPEEDDGDDQPEASNGAAASA